MVGGVERDQNPKMHFVEFFYPIVTKSYIQSIKQKDKKQSVYIHFWIRGEYRIFVR